MEGSPRLLNPAQIRQLTEMAERARAALTRYVGYEVAYGSTALQLLDEWIDRHVRQFGTPSQQIRLLWASFLGEVFRRRHHGEWALRGNGGGVMILCPTEGGDVREIDVAGRVDRRVAEGMSASLTYFYAVTSIELKSVQP